MKNCPYCNIEHIGGSSFGAHITNCKMNPKYYETINKISITKTLERKVHKLICERCQKEYEIIITDNDFNKGKYKKHCSRKCANVRNRTDESKLKTSNTIKNRISKGEIIIKGKRQELRIIKKCIKCDKKLAINNKSGLCNKCAHNLTSYKNKMSTTLIGRTGGYREKGGRGKQGWFNGFYCNSSWELAYVIYSLDNNMKIKRNTEGFEYIFEDKIFHFYPDFIKEDGSYVEVKGYLDNKNKAKINQFQKKLEVIDRNDIKPYLNYVVNKYGTDFIKLYE